MAEMWNHGSDYRLWSIAKRNGTFQAQCAEGCTMALASNYQCKLDAQCGTLVQAVQLIEEVPGLSLAKQGVLN